MLHDNLLAIHAYCSAAQRYRRDHGEEFRRQTDSKHHAKYKRLKSVLLQYHTHDKNEENQKENSTRDEQAKLT